MENHASSMPIVRISADAIYQVAPADSIRIARVHSIIVVREFTRKLATMLGAKGFTILVFFGVCRINKGKISMGW